MNAYFANNIADQRHAEMLAEAEAYRRSHSRRRAHAPRPARQHSSARRFVVRPVAAFQTWLGAGQL
ncbi:MAG: hypothetical protein JWO57_989 [Pseudonocardiales bacterium]|nr:hypothetical protein [Pseudonocardiales bacterium]